jgi:predicted esterase
MLAKLARTGAAPDTAHAAVILVHGRGATAESILSLVTEMFSDDVGMAGNSQEIAFVAPQAPGNTWYPYPFLAPIAQNEPYLSNALQTLADLFAELEKAGLPSERVALAGFSQGACLSLEFAARHARRYGGLAGLSGGLIGPPGTPRDYPGDLAGTPAFLGCSDVDPHIPEARVLETAQVLERMGAQVTTRIYPGMGHTVNEDELNFLRKMIERLMTGFE